MQEDQRTKVANSERIVSMAKDIEYIKIAMDELKKLFENLKQGYTSRDEFIALEKRVDAIESTITWVVRFIVGAVITALLSLVLIIKK